jgi:hypothetical protein
MTFSFNILLKSDGLKTKPSFFFFFFFTFPVFNFPRPTKIKWKTNYNTHTHTHTMHIRTQELNFQAYSGLLGNFRSFIELSEYILCMSWRRLVSAHSTLLKASFFSKICKLEKYLIQLDNVCRLSQTCRSCRQSW